MKENNIHHHQNPQKKAMGRAKVPINEFIDRSSGREEGLDPVGQASVPKDEFPRVRASAPVRPPKTPPPPEWPLMSPAMQEDHEARAGMYTPGDYFFHNNTPYRVRLDEGNQVAFDDFVSKKVTKVPKTEIQASWQNPWTEEGTISEQFSEFLRTYPRIVEADQTTAIATINEFLQTTQLPPREATSLVLRMIKAISSNPSLPQAMSDKPFIKEYQAQHLSPDEREVSAVYTAIVASHATSSALPSAEAFNELAPTLAELYSRLNPLIVQSRSRTYGRTKGGAPLPPASPLPKRTRKQPPQGTTDA